MAICVTEDFNSFYIRITHILELKHITKPIATMNAYEESAVFTTPVTRSQMPLLQTVFEEAEGALEPTFPTYPYDDEVEEVDSVFEPTFEEVHEDAQVVIDEINEHLFHLMILIERAEDLKSKVDRQHGRILSDFATAFESCLLDLADIRRAIQQAATSGCISCYAAMVEEMEVEFASTVAQAHIPHVEAILDEIEGVAIEMQFEIVQEDAEVIKDQIIERIRQFSSYRRKIFNLYSRVGETEQRTLTVISSTCKDYQAKFHAILKNICDAEATGNADYLAEVVEEMGVKFASTLARTNNPYLRDLTEMVENIN